jgi:hypothetical protein
MSPAIAIDWLAHARTPGPRSCSRPKALPNNSAEWENIFKSTLTEFEVTGVQSVSAQPFGTDGCNESGVGPTASLLGESELGTRKKWPTPKSDEAMPWQGMIGRLEPEVSSSEIFAALFELELPAKVEPLPGKHFVKAF